MSRCLMVMCVCVCVWCVLAACSAVNRRCRGALLFQAPTVPWNTLIAPGFVAKPRELRWVKLSVFGVFVVAGLSRCILDPGFDFRACALGCCDVIERPVPWPLLDSFPIITVEMARSLAELRKMQRNQLTRINKEELIETI